MDSRFQVKKSGCRWLLVTHEPLDPSEAWEKLKEEEAKEEKEESSGSVVIKFEPFILHVQCRTLEVAKRLHTLR